MRTPFTPAALALLVTAAPPAFAEGQRVASIEREDASFSPEERAPAADFADAAPETFIPNDRKSKAAAPYSVPFQLRSAGPSSALRLDQITTPYSASGTQGVVGVTSLSGAVRVVPTFSFAARASFVENSADGRGATSFANPILGAVWGSSVAPFRYGLALNTSLPVGTGGGNHPDPAVVLANRAGHFARFAMDGSWFAVNDFATTLGGDIAYVAQGLTLQAETSVTQLFRVRGELVSPDSYRANFLSGIHLGFWAAERLCIASEVRYQRWITTPEAVREDPAARHNMSVAAGLRTRIGSGKTKVMPGVAYATGLAGKVAELGMHAVQVDVPVVF